MSILRRKTKAGKGEDRTVSFHKEFEVLNYTPVDYSYTTQYANFLHSSETKFRRGIDNTVVDDLCDDMYDAYIDSIVRQMKSWAKEQYTYHMHLIGHYKGMIHGELICAEGHLENLKQDLDDIEQEMAVYKQLKQERNIL